MDLKLWLRGVHGARTNRESELQMVNRSAFFDRVWYAGRYGVPPQTAAAQYLQEGWKLGNRPSPQFEPECVVRRWPQAAKINPLLYFESTGRLDPAYSEDKKKLESSDMFDARWYKQAYRLPERVNASDHYLLFGCAHHHTGSTAFSPLRYAHVNLDVAQTGIDPFLHYVRYGRAEERFGVRRTQELRKGTQEQYQEACALQDERMVQTYDKRHERLVVYLVPDMDYISGGVMAIANYCAEIRGMPELEGAAVLMATNASSCNTFADYTMFDARDHVYRFAQLCSYFTNLRSLVLHIPDCEIENFIDRISGDEIAWLQLIPDVQINLLNQNNEMMPAPHVCDLLRLLGARLTMTCAHMAYATAQQRSTYNVPVHFIPADKRITYHVKSFEEKENLLVLSPDGHPQREKIVRKVLEAFPEMRVVEIWNTPFNEYLELIGKAMWVFSFGEGFDGYTIESMNSGTVSFTLFNDVFFAPGFVPWPNMFAGAAQMEEQIVDLMRSLQKPDAYYAFLNKTRAASAGAFTGYDYHGSLSRYYKGEYDYPLEPVLCEREERIKRRPLVSVVMATRQAKAFMQGQLDSIAAQTYDNVEVLVYDRGSTDGTADVLNACTSAVAEKGEAIGENAALLHLIRKAKGEYIALADQDDVWEPDKLEWLVGHIDEDAVCFGDVREIGGRGALPEGDGLWRTKKKEKLVTLKDCLHPERCAPACAMLVKRSKALEAAELAGEGLPLSWWILLHTQLFGGGCHFTDRVVARMRNHLGKALRAQLAEADENLPAAMDGVLSACGGWLDAAQKKELVLCRNGARMRALLSGYFTSGLPELFATSGAAFSDAMVEAFKEGVQKAL